MSRFNLGKAGGWVIFGLIAFALMLFSVLVFGAVEGTEFSAQKFAVREFRYHRLPLIGLQIWPVTFPPHPADVLAQHIRANQLQGSVRTLPVRWDIARMNSFARSQRGDPEILIHYLNQPGGKSGAWLDWTVAHPQLAKLLWPLIARLGHEQLYLLMPDLLEAASDCSGADAVDTFRRQSRQLLSARIGELADAYQAAGDSERAQAMSALLAELLQQIDSIETVAADDESEGAVAEATPTDAFSYGGETNQAERPAEANNQ